ncbi:penicillin acylase family protein [Fibrella aquatilis]|uniref:Penicillin acylase family protein n=1 Tax=Fibrella aquatilis TaxID=2817059 RepID=A0A939G9H7_9BACT|nr:penicillin acylase family protein [Fibrella aquatilis]MBO0932298.1 penicillin acylase family protein [Fibrella aquatilis]
MVYCVCRLRPFRSLGFVLLFNLLFLVPTLAQVAAKTAVAQAFSQKDVARWQQRARQVTITRDTWGVPHIYGKTDADVVFGLLFTQCEDDFGRVEENYITAIGRLAEIEGESALYHDLRARLFLDSAQAVAIYRKSPVWMKSLLDAFADGTNYYLYTHPEVKPKLLNRFEPWMPLLFSEGSIGGNISAVSIDRIKAFYEGQKFTSAKADENPYERESLGSNGFAIAPAKSATGHALLLINPHTSFYFRSEVHMVSRAGLNAYGAVTWGQFFVYQGFNEHCGWMHTTSYADSMDEYLETVKKKGDGYVYKHGTEQRAVRAKTVRLPYKSGKGMAYKDFTMYFTQHGPIAGEAAGKWIAIDMMNTPLNALSQSYLRTKATDYASYKQVMTLNGNASNNTIFADNSGNIAYWHGNFMPRRNPKFDWEQPVDGSNPATDWKGLHPVDDIVQVRNPATGWIQNCNATPFTVSGTSSPNPKNYPAYMAPDAQNYRGINADRVLSHKKIFTIDTLIAAANDPHLAAFDDLLPTLMNAWQTAGGEAVNRKPELIEAIQMLEVWDRNYGTESIGQTLAILWAEKLQRLARPRATADQRFDNLGMVALTIQNTSVQEKITALADVLADLTRDFGTWKMPWGEVNRYQRLTGKTQETYDDNQPSIPVGFTSSAWGSLAAFAAKTYPGTKKRYGSVGNSFVAVVEFGKRVKARSVVTGGQSSQPGTVHFADQAPLYCTGRFKDVLFYPEDIKKHVERTYRPGKK